MTPTSQFERDALNLDVNDFGFDFFFFSMINLLCRLNV